MRPPRRRPRSPPALRRRRTRPADPSRGPPPPAAAGRRSSDPGRRRASAGRRARSARAGPSPARRRARARRAGLAALSAGAASGENAPSDTRLARSIAVRSAPGRCSGSDLAVPAHALLAAPRILAPGEASGDDRPRRRADQLLRPAKVLARRVVRAAEVAPHPGLAENAADPEDQHSRHARQCSTLPAAPRRETIGTGTECDGRSQASRHSAVRQALAQAAQAVRAARRRGRRAVPAGSSAGRARARTSST